MRSRYEVARRWYRLKGRLLGIDQLVDDAFQPVLQLTSDRHVAFHHRVEHHVHENRADFAGGGDLPQGV